MAKRVALGKGLASLIQSDTHPEVASKALENFQEHMPPKENIGMPETGLFMVDISTLKMNPGQPRKIFKEKDLEELAESIKENGILQPLIVSKSEDGFQIIAGERRYRAAKKAGLSQVPVILKKVTDREKVVMAIIENVQRSDLNCVEEALAYYQLMEEFKLTQEEVAKKIGKDRSTVANFLRILKLPRQVIELLQKELLSFGHAKVLAVLKEREEAIRAANEAVASSLSVRELEDWIKKSFKRKPKSANAQEKFFDEKIDEYREKLEQKTGFHFNIQQKKGGSGAITIKYGNTAEFNDIFDYLLKR
jgi:ParB family transcriptional regulator, chromosome partitioning protein